jgi:hypothetical protein
MRLDFLSSEPKKEVQKNILLENFELESETT